MIPLLLATLLTATPAREARVVIETCPESPLVAAELLRLLTLELTDLHITHTATATDVFLAIAVPDCGPRARTVEIAALVAATGAGTTQLVRLDPRESSVARVVAVAAAERVRELLGRPPAPPPPAPAPSWSPTPEWEASLIARARAPAPPRAPERLFALHLGVDAFPSVASAAPTALAELTVVTSSSAQLRLDVGVLARLARERDLRGEVDLYAAAGTLALRAWIHTGPLELSAGPRLDVGWAGASGRPGSATLAGQTIHGFLGELWLDVLLRWPLSPSWSIGARASAGYLLSGLVAQADGVDITGVDGAALGVGLWIAVAP